MTTDPDEIARRLKIADDLVGRVRELNGDPSVIPAEVLHHVMLGEWMLIIEDKPGNYHDKTYAAARATVKPLEEMFK